MIIKTDFIIAKSDCIFSPGYIRVEDDRIADVSDKFSTIGEKVIDFSSRSSSMRTAILPGFINLHSHLELTGLMRSRHLISNKFGFPFWLFNIALLRPKRLKSQLKWVRYGTYISLKGGTTTLADVSYNNQSWQALRNLPIRKICFAELIGKGKSVQTQLDVLRHLRTEDDFIKPPEFFIGLAPHAPYSTDEEIYRESLKVAEKHNIYITTHLAEDLSEVEFIKSGEGPWRFALKKMKLLDKNFKGYGISPVEWAKSVGLVDYPKALLVHLNYVDDNDIQILAKGRASVVFCPQASRYFNHPPHKYAEMIEAGVNVTLGTDSFICSSPSMIDQGRVLYQEKKLCAEKIFETFTINSAQAIGLQDLIGTVESGKLADLVIVEIPNIGKPVLDVLFSEDVRVLACIVAGRFVPNGKKK